VSLPHRAVAVPLAFLAVLGSLVIVDGLPATPALAGPASGLCSMNTARGSIPGSFAIEGCINQSDVVLRNNLEVPVGMGISGSVGTPSRTPSDFGLAADATRLYDTSPLLLLPGDQLSVPLGSGASTITLQSTEAGGFYALATTAAAFVPAGAVVQAFLSFIAEVDTDYSNYQNCLPGKNWIEQLGCRAGLVGDVTFAVGRAVINGLAKSVLAVLLSTGTWLKFVAAQVPSVTQVLGSDRTIAVQADATNPAPASGSGGGSGAGEPAPGSTGSGATGPGGKSPTSNTSGGSPTPISPSSPAASIQIGWSAAHASWISMTLNGFATGAYTYSCDFASGGDASYRLTETSEPEIFDNGETCYDTQAGDQVWVTIGSVSSNRLTVAGSAPPPPPPPPPPPSAPTYSETPGSVVHTWTNYSDAGGSEGAAIPSNETVQVACRVQGFKVADGDTWWYRIASSPWNGAYYGSADAFYNNGETSGSLAGTPFYDPAVPLC
jgi:hypothetical protein